MESEQKHTIQYSLKDMSDSYKIPVGSAESVTNIDVVPKRQNDEEIVMEIHHGRRSNRYGFKGVINKIILGTVVLSTVLSSQALTTPVHAAALENEATHISQQYSISRENAMFSLKTTLNLIEQEKANGNVSQKHLYDLQDKLIGLDSALQADSRLDGIDELLAKTESVLDGLSGSEVDASKTIVNGIRIGNGLYSQAKTDKSTLTFSDVKEGSWYYDAVMDMTRRGIFAGTTEPVNGVGTFSPDSTMTRNQFIVTIVRYLYPDTEFTGENWYIGYVNQAIKDGILKANDFDDYNAPCSREEMAYLVMNAANHVGLEHGKADPSRIPDYNDISAKYRDSVRESFDAGIIAGTTTQGHFAPKSTMTRAQGATVLYRLITLKENEATSDNGGDKGNTDNQGETVQSQTDFSFSTLCMGSYMLDNDLFKFCPAYNGTVSSTYNVNDYINVMYDLETSKSLTGLDYENKYQADMNRAPITFKEGEEHVTPRPGDIVIRKSDGKAITITATILVYGGQKIGEILGLFQDVDIWTNTINEIYKRDYNVDCKYLDPGALETETRWGDHVAGQAQWKPTYIGVHDNRTDNTHFSQAFVYFIYGLTVGGEVHTTREWGSISTIANGYYYNNNLTKENCPFYVVIKGSLQYVGGEK